MAVVTALRPARGGVAVELDGGAWRTFPVTVVVEAGLGVGSELDRGRVRALARARRRHRAEQVAVRALSRREHSRASLDARLGRAGIDDTVRAEVLERAERGGLVDDARFAEQRARQLAERGAGDLLIVDDLVRQGVDDAGARAAVGLLLAEAERAAAIVERRGRSARTLRYLASRGFSEESLEPLIADFGSGALR
ncbi:MAG TPA: regulatory protein RecX [Gaiella sp.]